MICCLFRSLRFLEIINAIEKGEDACGESLTKVDVILRSCPFPNYPFSGFYPIRCRGIDDVAFYQCLLNIVTVFYSLIFK